MHRSYAPTWKAPQMSTPPHGHQPTGGEQPGPNYGQPQYGAQPNGQPPQPEPKKKKKWPLIVGIIVVLLVIAAACGGGDDSTSGDSTDTDSSSNGVGMADEATENTAEENAADEAPENAGDENATENEDSEETAGTGNDVAQGETVDLDGMLVTVSNIRNESDVLGTYICSDVSLQNNSGKQKSFSQFNFKLAKPNGVIADTTFTGLPVNNLETAELADGGQTTGTICFDSDGASGEYKVEYEGGFFSSDKATWAVTL